MRKSPSLPSLKALFAKSGNRCAFPGCENTLINEDGVFIGIVCHIEAASPKGQRYNNQQSDEERRHIDNLILLCPQHHKVTDDVDIYPVENMKQMKLDHELKFESYGYQIDYEVLSKISAEMEHFWYKIKNLNTVGHQIPDLAMEIRSDATYLELVTVIREDLNSLEGFCDSLRENDDTLETEVEALLEKHNIDPSFLEQIPYYEKPYVNRNWEAHCLGIPNFITSIRLNIDLIELKYLHLHLVVYPSDLYAKKRVKILKKQVEEYANCVSHRD